MQTIKYSYEVVFEKKNDMIFYSQIDLLHVLQRCLRRSNLPYYCTQGFNPRIKISFLTSLRLGVEGKMKTKLYFTQKITSQMITDSLSPQLPLGLKLLAITDLA